jgi:hypothetical protein
MDIVSVDMLPYKSVPQGEPVFLAPMLTCVKRSSSRV